MPKRDTKLFEVLIGQIAKDRGVDIVLGKALRVLGHAERFEPVRNLLHRGPSTAIERTHDGCSSSNALTRFRSTASNRSVDQIGPSARWVGENIVFQVSGTPQTLAFAAGRALISSYQRAKLGQSCGTGMPTNLAKSIEHSAVMSATVNRSPATNRFSFNCSSNFR